MATPEGPDSPATSKGTNNAEGKSAVSDKALAKGVGDLMRLSDSFSSVPGDDDLLKMVQNVRGGNPADPSQPANSKDNEMLKQVVMAAELIMKEQSNMSQAKSKSENVNMADIGNVKLPTTKSEGKSGPTQGSGGRE